jgi:hypothetical protein
MLTLSSCFYIIKSKFDVNIYIQWINNFISICNNFNLVIYTNDESVVHIKTYNNPRIKIIIKPIEQFYCYKYRDSWIKNHQQNMLLNAITGWELNMLWSEKIAFVQETATNHYFNTEYYGWCDIGYFRNRPNDTNTSKLSSWPNNDKIVNLDKNMVYYACINNSRPYINALVRLINHRAECGLPINPIPPDQASISGGFFLLHCNKIEWWSSLYYSTLERYFINGYLVKDDQIILADCIFSNISKFKINMESTHYDNWFMFQRLLL